MKLPISANTGLFICTTLLSSFCLVLSFENDEDHQLGIPLRLQDNMDQYYWPGSSDGVALRELFEAYRDGDAILKRAPAAGFYGMRGKKIPGQNFYGMRGKKGPSGFLGVRGKKMDPKYGAGYLSGGDAESPLDMLEDMWASKEYQGRLEHQDGGLLFTRPAALSKLSSGSEPALGDNSMANKRAPASGFMGLRGKRNLNLKENLRSDSH